MTTKIFKTVDYFEQLLLHFDLYDVDELNYFDLKECTELILNEFGYIPTMEEVNSYPMAMKIIEEFTDDRARQVYRSNCFNYRNPNTGDILKCRFVEPPIKMDDGKMIIFRSKDIENFFFGLNFQHKLKGSAPFLCPLTLLIGFTMKYTQTKASGRLTMPCH